MELSQSELPYPKCELFCVFHTKVVMNRRSKLMSFFRSLWNTKGHMVMVMTLATLVFIAVMVNMKVRYCTVLYCNVV